MKTFTVDEKNFNQVMGMLAKFFNHGDFICWHHWNGGMKKRINSRNIDTSLSFLDRDEYFDKHYDTKRIYHNVSYTFCKVGSTNNKRPEFNINLNHDEEFCISPNKKIKIAFIGNRIIIKSYYDYFKNYLYQCYQILK